KAKEMGIDWWEHDPSLSSRARPPQQVSAGHPEQTGHDAVAEENQRLRAELAELRAAIGAPQKTGGQRTEQEEEQ
ncbi:gas vesicle protein, partial [Streptomyces sp. NPDC048611]